MFNVGEYTLAPHKVVWKDIAADFAAAVPASTEPLPLPTHTAMLIAVGSNDEAHYICGLLNSSPARALIASYVATHISTHTPQIVHVPAFDPSSRAHRELAEASRACHDAVQSGHEPDEERVDAAAAAVWGISADEVAAARAFLDEMLKRDLER